MIILLVVDKVKSLSHSFYCIAQGNDGFWRSGSKLHAYHFSLKTLLHIRVAM